MIFYIIIVLIIIIAFCLIYFDMKQYKIKGGGGSKFDIVPSMFHGNEPISDPLIYNLDQPIAEQIIVENKIASNNDNCITIYPSSDCSVLNISVYCFTLTLTISDEEKQYYFIKLGQTSKISMLSNSYKMICLPELYNIHKYLVNSGNIDIHQHALTIFFKEQDDIEENLNDRIKKIRKGLDKWETKLHKFLCDKMFELNYANKTEGLKTLSMSKMQSILDDIKNGEDIDFDELIKVIHESAKISTSTPEYYMLSLLEGISLDDKSQIFDNLIGEIYDEVVSNFSAYDNYIELETIAIIDTMFSDYEQIQYNKKTAEIIFYNELLINNNGVLLNINITESIVFGYALETIPAIINHDYNTDVSDLYNNLGTIFNNFSNLFLEKLGSIEDIQLLRGYTLLGLLIIYYNYDVLTSIDADLGNNYCFINLSEFKKYEPTVIDNFLYKFDSINNNISSYLQCFEDEEQGNFIMSFILYTLLLTYFIVFSEGNINYVFADRIRQSGLLTSLCSNGIPDFMTDDTINYNGLTNVYSPIFEYLT